MRYDILVFAVVGFLLMAGFILQFLDLKGRGIVYALGAFGALLGLPTLYRMRKTRLKRHIEQRLRRLDEQALHVDALAAEFAPVASALDRTRTALQRARTDGLRQLAEIDAEARMPLAEAREYARRLSVEQLEGYTVRKAS
jgi:hypothetical protein